MCKFKCHVHVQCTSANCQSAKLASMSLNDFTVNEFLSVCLTNIQTIQFVSSLYPSLSGSWDAILSNFVFKKNEVSN